MKEFKCEICENVYHQKTTLRNHYNQKHNDTGKVDATEQVKRQSNKVTQMQSPSESNLKDWSNDNLSTLMVT